VETRRYDLTRELRDEAYRTLLAASLGFCDRAVLVVPPRSAAACEAKVDPLRPFVAFEFAAGQWPGTISWDAPATVYWLELSTACVEALSTLVDGLYDWQTVNGNPEDLALLSEDGREFLVSVAHECESWMWLTESERRELERRIPELDSLLGGQGA
jgi:hypothetical protein